ncbi:MAG: hypothetical protein J7539_06435 [Niabella sp.]|nr:hypothetical protein [Niabella sp.]
MNTGQEQQSSIPLDFYTKCKIITTSKTAGIAALLSIAGTLVSVLAFFLKPAPLPQPAKEGFSDNTAQLAAGGNLLMVIISLAISGLLFYNLFTFSRYAKKGLEQDDKGLLTRGLIALGAYFRILAVLAISFLGLLLMAILMTKMGGIG